MNYLANLKTVTLNIAGDATNTLGIGPDAAKIAGFTDSFKKPADKENGKSGWEFNMDDYVEVSPAKDITPKKCTDGFIVCSVEKSCDLLLNKKK